MSKVHGVTCAPEYLIRGITPHSGNRIVTGGVWLVHAIRRGKEITSTFNAEDPDMTFTNVFFGLKIWSVFKNIMMGSTNIRAEL